MAHVIVQYCVSEGVFLGQRHKNIWYGDLGANMAMFCIREGGAWLIIDYWIIEIKLIILQ
jgi:hypothetical protein